MKDIVSLCQRYFFGTPRTLADIRTEDAKYHGSNLNYKLDERSPAGICDRRSTLACMLLFCVAGAIGFGSTMPVLRGPAMQLTCNTHATHSQHNTHRASKAYSTCHAKEQHACQSAAPVTNTSETSFVQFVIQIATMIFCIFCPNVSQCPGRTKKVALAETDNVLRFSPGSS